MPAVTRARIALSPPRPTLVDRIDQAIERLYELRSIAANERRPHRATEQLLDDVDATGSDLRRAARG